MDDTNDAQGEKQSTCTSNAATVDDSSILTDPSLSSSEAVSDIEDGNSSDDDSNGSTTARGAATKSAVGYDRFNYLKRFSRQERRRIEGEILKGRKPGEPMTTYNFALASSCSPACPLH